MVHIVLGDTVTKVVKMIEYSTDTYPIYPGLGGSVKNESETWFGQY